MFLLGLSVCKIVFWDGLAVSIAALLRRRHARKILQGQIHAIEDIVATLGNLVAPGYTFSLSMLAAEISRQARNPEGIQAPFDTIRVLHIWISCFAQRWKLAWMSKNGGAARGVLLEIHSILPEVANAASALGAYVPDSDEEADEVHLEPRPNADLRRNWEEIRLIYNRVIDTFRSVNSVCASCLADLSVFEHTHLP